MIMTNRRGGMARNGSIDLFEVATPPADARVVKQTNETKLQQGSKKLASNLITL